MPFWTLLLGTQYVDASRWVMKYSLIVPYNMVWFVHLKEALLFILFVTLFCKKQIRKDISWPPVKKMYEVRKDILSFALLIKINIS